MKPLDLYGKRRRLPKGPVAFVDPGVAGTGLAVWHKLAVAKPRPVYWQTLWAPDGATWDDAARQIVGCVCTQCMLYKVRCVVIERPMHWGGSARSYAASESGDLINLAIMIGMLMREVEQHSIKTSLVATQAWKGQLSKTAVRSRIRRAIGVSVSAHAADAVGMGLSALGIL